MIGCKGLVNMDIRKARRWEENEIARAEEARATEEALRTGAKTALEIQEENSFIPWTAEIKIDFAAASKRFEEEHG